MATRNFICVLVPLVISSIIFYLCCLMQGDEIPAAEVILPFNIQMDKAVHYVMYFGLSGATAFTCLFLKKGRMDMKKLIAGAFILPILYGGAIEILQEMYFPPRSGDRYDFLADFVGSASVFPLAMYYRKSLLNKTVGDK